MLHGRALAVRQRRRQASVRCSTWIDGDPDPAPRAVDIRKVPRRAELRTGEPRRSGLPTRRESAACEPVMNSTTAVAAPSGSLAGRTGSPGPLDVVPARSVTPAAPAPRRPADRPFPGPRLSASQRPELPVATRRADELADRRDRRARQERPARPRPMRAATMCSSVALVRFAATRSWSSPRRDSLVRRPGSSPVNPGSDGPGVDGGARNPPATAGDGYRTSYLWERVWQPEAWLDRHPAVPARRELADGDGRRKSVHDKPMIFPAATTSGTPSAP